MDALLAIKIAAEVLRNQGQMIEDPNQGAEEANPGAYQRSVVEELERLVNSVEEGAVLLWWPD
jgi:hypothetical protein